MEQVPDYNVSVAASLRHDLTGMNGGGRSPHQKKIDINYSQPTSHIHFMGPHFLLPPPSLEARCGFKPMTCCMHVLHTTDLATMAALLTMVKTTYVNIADTGEIAIL